MPTTTSKLEWWPSARSPPSRDSNRNYISQFRRGEPPRRSPLPLQGHCYPLGSPESSEGEEASLAAIAPPSRLSTAVEATDALTMLVCC
ncbi:hypothetical protein CRG98_027857 [Punica granatum]|uniref:Uncharacterized protein n=1 Tax=Punica granatum TaxID=22663 RepID=A0A2I0J643_PUNGR|nr:hypothetical protein CRG98_027857 [Punica granatum]